MDGRGYVSMECSFGKGKPESESTRIRGSFWAMNNEKDTRIANGSRAIRLHNTSRTVKTQAKTSDTSSPQTFNPRQTASYASSIAFPSFAELEGQLQIAFANPKQPL